MYERKTLIWSVWNIRNRLVFDCAQTLQNYGHVGEFGDLLKDDLW